MSSYLEFQNRTSSHHSGMAYSRRSTMRNSSTEDEKTLNSKRWNVEYDDDAKTNSNAAGVGTVETIAEKPKKKMRKKQKSSKGGFSGFGATEKATSSSYETDTDDEDTTRVEGTVELERFDISKEMCYFLTFLVPNPLCA